jgi:hypothetical protein
MLRHPISNANVDTRTLWAKQISIFLLVKISQAILRITGEISL